MANIKKGNIKLTLSVNEKIIKNYKQYCEENGLVISRQVEKFMEEQINDKENNS